MKNFAQEWETAYQSEARHKNIYPSEAVISYVMRNFPDKKDLTALDIGAGWGNNLKFLLDLGFDAIGTDISSVAVDQLRNSLVTYGKNRAILIENSSKLPFANNHFDFILDRSSVQHNKKPDVLSIINEVHRCLKPGGRFFSIMLKQGDNGFSVTKLKPAELKNALSIFSYFDIETVVKTKSDGSKHANYYIDCVK